MKRAGRFVGSAAKPIPINLERLGLDKFATTDPEAMHAWISRAAFVKALTPDDIKAAFYLQDRFAVNAAQSLNMPLGSIAVKFGMKPARVYPIRFMAQFFEALRSGEKTETRRTSAGWANVQPGDLLRVLSPSPNPPTELFRVLESYRQPIAELDEASIRREGFATRAEFEEVWARLHPENPPEVHVLRFEENESATIRILKADTIGS